MPAVEMAGQSIPFELGPARHEAWPWRVGIIIDSGELVAEISGALSEMNAQWEFHVAASAPAFEIAGLIQRQRPDVIFVELAAVEGSPVEWINIIRPSSEIPLVVALHSNAEPAGMIAAMRAGASEFVSSPVRPGIFETMDRVGTQLEARQTTTAAPGRMLGVLSAKGGCGATTLACHLAVAMQMATGTGRVLLADLDHQSPGVDRVYRSQVRAGVTEAFDSVRRLNSACWPEFVTPVTGSVDLLSAARGTAGPEAGLPEPWRIENLFRFVRRHYSWILADLGRQVNPSNWAFLPNIEDLLLVTAPDVPALYQTRSVLQALAYRGFKKSRVHLVLNRNQKVPQDFWIESIEQMFDMKVLAVLPYDMGTLGKMPRHGFEFPATSAYGRSVSKLAGLMLKSAGAEASALGATQARAQPA